MSTYQTIIPKAITSEAYRTSFLVMMCSSDGTIIQLLQNNFNLNSDEIENRPFYRIVNRDSTAKAMNFIVHINHKRVVSDWEMNLAIKNQCCFFHFFGGCRNGHLLIVGAQSKEQSKQLFNSLFKIPIRTMH